MKRILLGCLLLMSILVSRPALPQTGWMDAVASRVVRLSLINEAGSPVGCGVGFALSPTAILTALHVVRDVPRAKKIAVTTVRGEHTEIPFDQDGNYGRAIKRGSPEEGFDVTIVTIPPLRSSFGQISLASMTWRSLVEFPDVAIASFRSGTCSPDQPFASDDLVWKRTRISEVGGNQNGNPRLVLDDAGMDGDSGSPVISLKFQGVVAVYIGAADKVGQAASLAERPFASLYYDQFGAHVPVAEGASRSWLLELYLGAPVGALDSHVEESIPEIGVGLRCYDCYVRPVLSDLLWFMPGIAATFEKRNRTKTLRGSPSGVSPDIEEIDQYFVSAVVSPVMLRFETTYLFLGADPLRVRGRILVGNDYSRLIEYQPAVSIGSRLIDAISNAVGLRGSAGSNTGWLTISLAYRVLGSSASVKDAHFNLLGNPQEEIRTIPDPHWWLSLGWQRRF